MLIQSDSVPCDEVTNVNDDVLPHALIQAQQRSLADSSDSENKDQKNDEKGLCVNENSLADQSVVQADNDDVDCEDSVFPVPAPNLVPALYMLYSVLNPLINLHFSSIQLPQPFHYNVEWSVKDVHMLLGSDLPIFGIGEHPAITLRLR